MAHSGVPPQSINAVFRSPVPAALGFGLAYVLCATVSQALALAPDSGATAWLPSGLFVGALLRMPRSYWPLIALTAIGADLIASIAIFSFAPTVACVVAVGNACEALAGAWLLSKGRGFRLEDERSALGLIAICAFGSTLLSAMIGGTAVSLYMNQPLASGWIIWWTGDAAGVLMLAPAMLLPDAQHVSRRRAWELAWIMAVALAGGHVLFRSGYPVLYLLFPLMIWAAMRQELLGASLLGMLTIAQVLAYSRLGMGPFASIPSAPWRQLLAQTFLLTLASTGLLLAGVCRKRSHALQQLRESSQNAERVIQQRTQEIAERERELRVTNNLLRDADAHKDRFLATLSHEIRNPLSAIRAGVAVLGREVAPEVRDRVRASVERQTGLLIRLADDLLDVARIREGKLSIEMRPVTVASVVGAAVESVRVQLEARNHALHIDLVAGDHAVQGDFGRLVQALANLLTNACRYTADGGRIEISAIHVGDRVEIGVADNGIGFDPNDASALFALYAQGANGDRGGLGIGLALVRSIVELHGGEVRATSAGPGRGSVFVLALPLRAGESPATP